MDWRQPLHRLGFGRSAQVVFLEDFFQLLEDGIAPGQALQWMSHADKGLTRRVAITLMQRLEQGQSIAEAMTSWFHPHCCATVAAAEQSAEFAATGLKLIQPLRDQHELLGEICLRLLPPTGYIGVILVLYAWLSQEFFPLLAHTRPQEQWPMASQFIYGLGHHCHDFGIWYLTGVAALLVGVWLWLALMTAEFGLALGWLLRFRPAHLRFYLQRIQQRLLQGYSLPVCLDVGLFPRQELERLRLLSMTSHFNQAICKLGRNAHLGARRSLKRRILPLQLLLFVIAGSLYAGVGVAIYSTV